MEQHIYQGLYKREKTYWWSRAKHELVLTIIRRYGGAIRGKKILDVGCGAGGFLTLLIKQGAIGSGIDSDPAAIEFAERRGLKQVRLANAEELPFAARRFQIVSSLDALEHIKRDQIALTEFYRVLQPGGLAVVTVPAFPSLLTERDRRLDHLRRYRKPELVKKFAAAKFQVVRATYITAFFFPLLWGLARRKTKIRPAPLKIDFLIVPGWLNWLFYKFLKAEEWLLRYADFPFGTSLLVVARKPGQGDSFMV